MRTVKRIVKIHKIKGFQVFCLFNNGESRIIDFEELFKIWKVKKGDIEFKLKKSVTEFKKVQLNEGTLTWPNITYKTEDDLGNELLLCYDLDPIVLYENSQLDESRQLEIGMLIKKTRSELGLTQEELAKKSGTTKHYISRIENDKTGLEISTLKRIIEGGLGKRMKISIL